VEIVQKINRQFLGININTSMKNIIKKLSKDSKKSEKLIEILLLNITENLLIEGCTTSDPRYMQYLIRRARKRLKIPESNTYKTFKNFFKESN